MIHSGDIVKFSIELHPEMGGVNLSRLFAPADRKIKAGVIPHPPCIGVVFPGLTADGRIAGIERLPFITVISYIIRNHRILGYKNPYIQKFNVHQKASFLEPNRRERSVMIKS